MSLQTYQQPKFFTIVLPIYNPTRLKKCLDSIQSQPNLEDIEVAIINDAGSLEYKELLKDYTFDMIVIDNEENIGQGLSRQVGIDNTSGEWITFIDHDDEFNPQCFDGVKKGIIDTQCSFVYSTKSLVANDYNFIDDYTYMVEDNGSVLHGHFYNRKMLEKYDIRFCPKIRAHEDTYFLTAVQNYMLLDIANIGGSPQVFDDLITYYWFLWDDSQTHTYKKGSSYLERTICDYVVAMWEVYTKIIKDFPNHMQFTVSILCGALMILYWYEQSFKYERPNDYLDNDKHIKWFVENIMGTFNMKDVKELTNLLLDLPDMYMESFKSIIANVDGAFVPRETIEQFYWNVMKNPL